MDRARWISIGVGAAALIGLVAFVQSGTAAGAPSAQESSGDRVGGLTATTELTGASREWWTQLSASAQVQSQPLVILSLSDSEIASVEEDRQKLIDWVDTLLEVHPHLTTYAEPGGREALEKLRVEAEIMPPEELAVAMAELPVHDGFWQYPQLVLSIFEPTVDMPPYYEAQAQTWSSYPGILIRRAQLEGKSLVADEDGQGSGLDAAPPTPVVTPPAFPPYDPFPPRGSIENPDNRAGCPGVFTERTCMWCPPSIPLEVVFAAETAKIIATGLNDASGTAEQDICSPPGVGFTVPKVWKYVFIGAQITTDAIVRALSFYNDLSNECEGGYHNGLIDLYLDETVSSRVSQESLDEHVRSQLRIEIENNLLNQADDRISLFQLPEEFCGDGIRDDTGNGSPLVGYKWCGQLEYVREIVDETINANAAAGSSGDIALARAEFEAGDNHYMSSQWKSAYERYSQAYRYVVRQSTVR